MKDPSDIATRTIRPDPSGAGRVRRREVGGHALGWFAPADLVGTDRREPPAATVPSTRRRAVALCRTAGTALRLAAQ